MGHNLWRVAFNAGYAGEPLINRALGTVFIDFFMQSVPNVDVGRRGVGMGVARGRGAGGGGSRSDINNILVGMGLGGRTEMK